MLKFKHNVDKYQEEQYISDRDLVRLISKNTRSTSRKSRKTQSGSTNTKKSSSTSKKKEKGRSLVRIQGDKTDVKNKKQSILPELQLPDFRKDAIDENGFIMMGVACVMESFVEKTGEIEFCIVENKRFVTFPNTKEEKQVEQLYFVLKQNDSVSEQNGLLKLEATLIKLTGQLHNEKGRVLFRLSQKYIQEAGKNGFQFGSGEPLHRLVIYLYKYNNELDAFEPDWQSLCLSDYIHQRETESSSDEEMAI